MKRHTLFVRMWFTILLIGFCFMIALFLTGCAGAVIRSNVPVTVSCVEEMPIKPAYRTKTLPTTANDAEKVRAIVLDWLDSRPYEAELEAGLTACR